MTGKALASLTDQEVRKAATIVCRYLDGDDGIDEAARSVPRAPCRVTPPSGPAALRRMWDPVFHAPPVAGGAELQPRFHSVLEISHNELGHEPLPPEMS